MTHYLFDENILRYQRYVAQKSAARAFVRKSADNQKPVDTSTLRSLHTQTPASSEGENFSLSTLLIDLFLDAKIWLGFGQPGSALIPQASRQSIVIVSAISLAAVLLVVSEAGRVPARVDQKTEKGFKSLSLISKRVLTGTAAPAVLAPTTPAAPVPSIAVLSVPKPVLSPSEPLSATSLMSSSTHGSFGFYSR